jgi:chromosome segregation ATPase
MRARLERRLDELHAERDRGLQKLAALKNEQRDLERTLLRIQGAIQVLEEELARDGEQNVIPIERPR